MSRTWQRWLPAGAVVAIIAGTVALTSQAGAVDLPDKSPQDVLVMLAEHDITAYSGTFETTTELGLPMPTELDLDLGPSGPDLDDAELDMSRGMAHGPRGSGADGPGVLTALELLMGDNTGRVFVGGPGQARFQHIDAMAERNVVVNDRDVWFYDSETNEAVHLVLPDPADLPALPEGSARHGTAPMPDGELPTPDELAAMVVELLEPSTEVTVGQHERVAGRDAYTLQLAPRAAETLVEQVSIAVDGETGFPLGVTMHARGQAEPALHAAYTDIDFSAPDAALFDFFPPADATVQEEQLELPEHAAHDFFGGHDKLGLGGHDGDDGGSASFGWGADGSATSGWGDDASGHAPRTFTPGDVMPQVLGEGWGTVVVLEPGDLPEEPLLDQLTEPVEGGRMISTALLNVLLTDDGRVLAGAVTPGHLLDLAGR